MVSFFQFGGSYGGLLLPWRTLLLTTLALAGYLILGAAPEAWVFNRTAIGQGEVWRLVTGHWVHSDFEHALWDIGALGLLGVLFEKRLQGHLFLALVIGTSGVDVWLWWGNADLHYYCGLSGILNSLLAVGLVQLWRDLRHPLVWLIGLGAIVKVLLEISGDKALLTQTAWPSVPEVHAVGFLSGLVIVIAMISHIPRKKILPVMLRIRNQFSTVQKKMVQKRPSRGVLSELFIVLFRFRDC